MSPLTDSTLPAASVSSSVTPWSSIARKHTMPFFFLGFIFATFATTYGGKAYDR